MWKPNKVDLVNEKDALFHDLIDEVNHSNPGAQISFALRNKLEKFPFESRRDIVNRVKQGCSPLFTACQKGQQEIVEYLIHTCGADIEQKGTYEVQAERSSHIVTPLWCAAVTGKLSIVEILLKAGADINAVSDSGSTPVRSTCFMTHFDVVHCLVLHGADINKPNYNGGTCLINSVQSPPLCDLLLQHGADVNAKDIQNKTALHYAIQEHRLQTTQLLLKYGADHTAVSRYGDDALQMACLKGAMQIFEYLIQNIPYSQERIANARELLGSTFLDDHNDISVCLENWTKALKLRDEYGLHPKQPIMPPQESYRGQSEFETEDELLALSGDLDKLKVESLLIAERVLGSHHKDTIYRLMYRGAAYADVMRHQRCIDIWRRALQIRIEKDSVLYTDTCFTAQALVKLMVDFNIKSELNNTNNVEQRFHDIVETFKILTHNILDVRALLLIRPQYKRQLDVFEKILRCITYLVYLMIETAKSQENIELVDVLLRGLIRSNLKGITIGDSILHQCVSRLTTIKSAYFIDEEPITIFPRENVLKRLLDCGANVNIQDDKGSTPLHVATKQYNYSHELVKLLLDYGAHLDQPNDTGHTPLDGIADLLRHNISIGNISLLNYTSLKCLCSRIIVKDNIPYEGVIPKELENFVRSHTPF